MGRSSSQQSMQTMDWCRSSLPMRTQPWAMASGAVTSGMWRVLRNSMARAASRLLPMFAHGFDEEKCDATAKEQARHLLAQLQVEGLYG